MALADGMRRSVRGSLPAGAAPRRPRAGDGRHRRRRAGPSWPRPGSSPSGCPRTAGGVGLGMAAAAVVFEELGPGPRPGAAPGHAIWRRGLVEGAADGKVVVGAVAPAGAVSGRAGRWRRSWSTTSVRSGASSSWAKTGWPRSTPPTLDGGGGRPVARSADPAVAGRPPAGGAADRRARGGGAVATGRSRCSAGRCWWGWPPPRWSWPSPTPKQREQFGKPIGSFQAVKHLCADMLVAAETARAAVHAAAVTIDQPEVGDADRAAAGAGSAGGRGGHRERQDLHPGPRGDGLHLGGAGPPLSDAGPGAGRVPSGRRRLAELVAERY